MKDVQGECQHCRELFNFAADAIGTTADCPHCGQPTELMLAQPPETPSPLRSKGLIYLIVALIIVIAGGLGIRKALIRAKEMTGEGSGHPPAAQATAKPVSPFAAQGFEVSLVTLESEAGTKVVYAQGTISNTSREQRFGVKVEVDLFDATGKWIAATSDYRSVLEAGAQWKFRALVTEGKAVSAKVSKITESKK